MTYTFIVSFLFFLIPFFWILLVQLRLYPKVEIGVSRICNHFNAVWIIELIEFGFFSGVSERFCYENPNFYPLSWMEFKRTVRNIPSLSDHELGQIEINILSRKGDFIVSAEETKNLNILNNDLRFYVKYTDKILSIIQTQLEQKRSSLYPELDRLKFDLPQGFLRCPSTLKLIGERLFELGYLDRSHIATKELTTRFVGYLRKCLAESDYQWDTRITSIRDQTYFICKYYKKDFPFYEPSKLPGSYKQDDINDRHLSDLKFIFKDVCDVCRALQVPTLVPKVP